MDVYSDSYFSGLFLDGFVKFKLNPVDVEGGDTLAFFGGSVKIQVEVNIFRQQDFK